MSNKMSEAKFNRLNEVLKLAKEEITHLRKTNTKLRLELSAYNRILTALESSNYPKNLGEAPENTYVTNEINFCIHQLKEDQCNE